MSQTRKETFRFADQVAAGETDEFEANPTDPARITNLDVRIYPGPELNLRIRPYVVDGANRRPLVNFKGKDHIDGDDDVWQFDISEPITTRETLLVEVENTGTDAYDFAVNASIDYLNGTNRVIEWLL